MKLKIALIIAVMAGSTSAPGQTGFIVHFDSVQAGKSGYGSSVRQVDDGFLIYCIQNSHENLGAQHVFVRKISQTGVYEHEFEYRIGDNSNYDIGYIDPVANLPDETQAATIKEGFFYSGETWFYKFNSEGDTLLRKFLMSYPLEDSVTHAIRQTRSTSDGGFILCGFYQTSNNPTQALLIRLDANADTLWSKKLGIAQYTEIILGVEEYPDGGFILSGYKLDGSPWDSSLLIRTNPSGQVQWTRYFGELGNTNAAVKITLEGDIVTWTNYREQGWQTNYYEKMLTKWDPSGNIIWQKKSDYAYYSDTWDLEQLADGSFLGSGFSGGWPVIAKFNSQGDSLWSRTYMVTNDLHYLYDVEPTSDGGFIATGGALRYIPLDSAEFHQSQTIFAIKTDSLGCIVPGCQTVGVEEYALDLNEYLTVFPNPVAQGGALNISFNPPQEYKAKGPFRVVVLDAMGRHVLEQLFTNHPSPLTSLETGMYYLHLTDGTTWLAGSAFVVE